MQEAMQLRWETGHEGEGWNVLSITPMQGFETSMIIITPILVLPKRVLPQYWVLPQCRDPVHEPGKHPRHQEKLSRSAPALPSTSWPNLVVPGERKTATSKPWFSMIAGNWQHQVVESYVRPAESCRQDCHCFAGNNYCHCFAGNKNISTSDISFPIKHGYLCWTARTTSFNSIALILWYYC